MTDLFEPLQLGELVLSNRIILAPMTRSRSDANGVINEFAFTYYSQRANAGMIVTEGVNISPMSMRSSGRRDYGLRSRSRDGAPLWPRSTKQMDR